VLQKVNSRIAHDVHKAAEALRRAEKANDRIFADRDLRDLGSTRNQLVAIVDDDLHVREGLNEFVLSLGHASVAFRSAEDYLTSNLNGDTACLILDVNLPGMNGPDLQARLIDGGHCAPIIFLTGRFDDKIRSRVLRAGALAYLAKPCREKELTDCIKKALEG
jgi:FixJ family two-component response regulator